MVVASGLSSADAALEAAGAGTWQWGLSGQCVGLSLRAAHLLGATSQGVSREQFIQLVHPYDRRGMERSLNEYLFAGQLMDVDFRLANGQWCKSAVGPNQAKI